MAHSPDFYKLLLRVPRSHRNEVLVTRNQVALLNGLYDRPAGAAVSCRDWIASATPYRRLLVGQSYDGALAKSLRRVPREIVSRRREGRQMVCTLTELGRAIVERTVPVWVVGYGPYCGVRGMRRH